ncbi:MAG: phage tail protein [Acidobacteriota bacterium]|nr:phage tail protein [Acidobacteriota bacterium]
MPQTAIAAFWAGLSAGTQAFLFNVGSAMLLGFVQKKLLKSSLRPEAERQGRLLNEINATPYRRTPYGLARVGANYFFRGLTGDKNQNLHIGLMFSHRRIDGFEGFFVDEKYITPNLLAADGRVQLNEFKDKLYVDLFEGNQTQASPLLLEHQDWTADDVGRGIAGAAFKLIRDDEVYKDGVPLFTFLARGVRLYDPRTAATAFTRLSALVLRDLVLTHLAYDETEIDDESFIAAANICALPDPNFPDQPLYACDGILSEGQEVSEMIDWVLASMNGVLWYSGGKYHCAAGYWSAPVLDITDADIIGEVNISALTPKADHYNAVQGTFVDPDRFEEMLPFYAQVDVDFEAVDGRRRWKDITLHMVRSQSQAQRIARQILLSSRMQQQFSVPVRPAVGAAVQIWDVVTVTKPELGWHQQTFRVIDWERDRDGSYTLTLQQDDPAVYDWDPADLVTAANVGLTLNGNELPDPPANLRVEKGVPGSARLVWDPPATRIAAVEIHTSISDDVNTAQLAAIARGSEHLLSVPTGTVLYVWARSVDLAGRHSSWEPDGAGLPVRGHLLAAGEAIRSASDHRLTTRNLVTNSWFKWWVPVDGIEHPEAWTYAPTDPTPATPRAAPLWPDMLGEYALSIPDLGTVTQIIDVTLANVDHFSLSLACLNGTGAVEVWNLAGEMIDSAPLAPGLVKLENFSLRNPAAPEEPSQDPSFVLKIRGPGTVDKIMVNQGETVDPYYGAAWDLERLIEVEAGAFLGDVLKAITTAFGVLSGQSGATIVEAAEQIVIAAGQFPPDASGGLVSLINVLAGLIESIVTEIKTDGTVDYTTGNITGASRIDAAFSGISQNAQIIANNGLTASTNIINRVQAVEGEVGLVDGEIQGQPSRIDTAEANIQANADLINDEQTGLVALLSRIDVKTGANSSALAGVNGSLLSLYSFLGVEGDPPTASDGGRLSGIILKSETNGNIVLVDLATNEVTGTLNLQAPNINMTGFIQTLNADGSSSTELDGGKIKADTSIRVGDGSEGWIIDGQNKRLFGTLGSSSRGFELRPGAMINGGIVFRFFDAKESIEMWWDSGPRLRVRSTVSGREGTTEVRPDGFYHNGLRFHNENGVPHFNGQALKLDDTI